MRWLNLALLVACSGSSTTSQATTEEGASAQSGDQGSTAVEESTEARPDPSPAPPVRVSALPPRDGVGLRLQMRGDESARVRSQVQVERREGERWERVSAELLLRASCDATPGECLELEPGAELLPPPLRGEGQCCQDCEPMAAGQYRFVALSCAPEGTSPHRIASAPFVVR